MKKELCRLKGEKRGEGTHNSMGKAERVGLIGLEEDESNI